MTRRSPWQRALGGRESALDDALQAYFAPIPRGSVGRGTGVFADVGTPRRWLWPVLGLFAREGIAFPAWERDVPFTVVNRPSESGTLLGTRTFHFPDGDRVMVDEIGTTRAGLVDRLGRRGTVSVVLVAVVVDGGLTLGSSGATIRIGRVRIPLGRLSPRVTLSERSADTLQRVSLRIDYPVVGLVYEYAGEFSYRIEEES